MHLAGRRQMMISHLGLGDTCATYYLFRWPQSDFHVVAYAVAPAIDSRCLHVFAKAGDRGARRLLTVPRTFVVTLSLLHTP